MQLLAEVKVPKTWILFNKKLLTKKKTAFFLTYKIPRNHEYANKKTPPNPTSPTPFHWYTGAAWPTFALKYNCLLFLFLERKGHDMTVK